MSTLEFTRARDEATLCRHQAVVAAGFTWDFEALPADPVVDYLPVLSGPVGGLVVECWVGSEGGTDVVAALTRCPIHDNLDLPKPSHHALDGDTAAPGPLLLQDHGTRVRYRNAESHGFEFVDVTADQHQDLKRCLQVLATS